MKVEAHSATTQRVPSSSVGHRHGAAAAELVQDLGAGGHRDGLRAGRPRGRKAISLDLARGATRSTPRSTARRPDRGAAVRAAGAADCTPGIEKINSSAYRHLIETAIAKGYPGWQQRGGA
ncbi:MAG: hypothetical protein U0W40_06530 [Acidimicrobiia bacterium]